MNETGNGGQTDIAERIEALNAIGAALSNEPDGRRLLEMILEGAKRITGADGGSLYTLVDEERLRFDMVRTDSLGLALGGPGGDPVDLPEVPLHLPDGAPNHASVVAHAVLTGRTVNLPDAYAAAGFDFSGTRAFDARTGYRSRSMLTVPMRDHEDRIVGVLQLLNARGPRSGAAVPFSAADQRLAESLASQAAIKLSNRSLLAEITALFEAFVETIAGAVDDKSPHTGQHCRRVHDLAVLLAEAVDADEGPMAETRLAPEERHAIGLAAWLHDCGKITTPDWLMDKATKLERPYDRIEAVAARFAAAKAQAEAEARSRIADGADPTTEWATLDADRAALDADLALLRGLNRGEVPADAEACARVRRLSARRWIDAAGDERPLLDDDEAANLCIPRGTLLPRERRVLEAHAAATADLLARVSFPRHLRQVPEIAANHHERLDGSGYPRGLRRGEMSLPARLLAVCDVFEALTAPDRPYRPPLPLSRAMDQLAHMVADGRLDPDVFAVFVRSGVYRRFAEERLSADQRDAIAEEAVLAAAGCDAEEDPTEG